MQDSAADHAVAASPWWFASVQSVGTVCAQVTGVLLTGGWPGDSAEDALSLSLGGCAAVDAVMRETLRNAATSR